MAGCTQYWGLQNISALPENVRLRGLDPELWPLSLNIKPISYKTGQLHLARRLGPEQTDVSLLLSLRSGPRGVRVRVVPSVVRFPAREEESYLSPIIFVPSWIAAKVA